MDRQKNKHEKLLTVIFYTARNLCIAAGIFSLLLCTMLLLTYIQIKTRDPLATPAIASLLQKIEADPEDQALREQIRGVDLLARKAYFTSQWQLQTGGRLLLAGTAVLALSLTVLFSLKSKFPASLKGKKLNDAWLEQAAARKAIAITGGGLVLAALFVAFLSHNPGREYFPGDTTAPAQSAEVKSTTTQGASETSPTDAAGEKQGSNQADRPMSPAQVLETLPYAPDFLTNWPNFRGPGGFGLAYAGKAPSQWDGASGKNILWKVSVPKPGFNSPVVWGSLLFLSGADEQSREVFCFNADTGALVWRRQVKDIEGSPAKAPQVSPDTGYAPSTMATNGRSVFAIFPTADVICFDFQGARIWARNLGVPANHYGHASSLLTYKNLLFIQYDQDQGSRLLALDAATGRSVWETDRSDVYTSWTTPIIIPRGRAGELILAANPYVKAYDPDSGKELWKVECLGGEVGSSPAYSLGRVFSSNQFSVLTAFDLGTGKISWQAYDNLPDAASLLAAGKFLIVPTGYGIVTCYDTLQGKVLWQQEFPQGFFSSPVLVGDLVYLQNRQGTMYIFKAREQFELVSAPELGEPSDCTAAFVKNRIYIRGKNNLYCIEERP